MGFLAFFTAIVNTIKLINGIVAGAKAIADFIQANKDQAWFQASNDAFKDIRNAKTPEDHIAAAKKLRDSWGGL